MSFVPTLAQLFFSKNDPDDPRLGDHFKNSQLSDLDAKPLDRNQPDDFALLGYPDDEGIKLNGGRPGAAEAPKLIRQFLYKMTWPPGQTGVSKNYLDFGDLSAADKLEIRHEEALQAMTKLHERKFKTISFGGGHDYGYPDAAGFVRAHLNGPEKALVINFDAHLDVRPTHNGFNSGHSV